MTKIAIPSHCLSPLSGKPGVLKRADLLEGTVSTEEMVIAWAGGSTMRRGRVTPCATREVRS